jgi:hypothetical protein
MRNDFHWHLLSGKKLGRRSNSSTFLPLNGPAKALQNHQYFRPTMPGLSGIP